MEWCKRCESHVDKRKSFWDATYFAQHGVDCPFTPQSAPKILINKLGKAVKRETKADGVWEVWQGQTLICSAAQKLTEHEARNKVANEARHGVIMEARPAARSVLNKTAPRESTHKAD